MLHCWILFSLYFDRIPFFAIIQNYSSEQFVSKTSHDNTWNWCLLFNLTIKTLWMLQYHSHNYFFLPHAAAFWGSAVDILPHLSNEVQVRISLRKFPIQQFFYQWIFVIIFLVFSVARKKMCWYFWLGFALKEVINTIYWYIDWMFSFIEWQQYFL